MSDTMKALVYHGPNQICLDDVPRPQLEQPDDILIKVTLSAICTSDVHIAAGHLPARRGQILGHEFCGEIAEVGSDVRGFKPGDRVMVEPSSHCGQCDNCRQGIANRLCLGKGHGIFGINGSYGAQAEYMRLPQGPLYTRLIPDSLTYEDVILVPDMLATAWFGVKKARIGTGDTVVVVGCGPVGLSACLVARLAGARTIIAVDILDYPLEAALRAGAADFIINQQKEDVLPRIKEITGGRMAHAVIETVGISDSFTTALNAAGLYGRVCTVAVFSGPLIIPTIYTSAVLKNLEITMGIQECAGIDELVAAIQSGKIDTKFMLTHRAPLNDILSGYEVFSHKKDNCIKWLVTPFER